MTMTACEMEQTLREQARTDYGGWLRGEEPPKGTAWQGAVGEKVSARDFLALLHKLHKEIPPQVDYGLIYSACVLSRNFEYLKMIINPLPKLGEEDLATLFQFAKIFLNVGLYEECVACCSYCLHPKFTAVLDPRKIVKILFAKSKAQRNMGHYQQALEDLREALRVIADCETDISYLMGAALIRIGKVYSHYLMMMSVSLCFLNEAKERLEPWLNSPDLEIREESATEYAICLDSIGQYWKRNRNNSKEMKWFQQAEDANEGLERMQGTFRVHSHIIMTQYKSLLADPAAQEELEQMVQDLKYIIRKLEDDPANQRGASVRLLHLAELQLAMGKVSDAEYSIKKCREMATLYRDEKTLIRLEIVELEYCVLLGDVDRKQLSRAMESVRGRNNYGYEIELNNAVIAAIGRGALSREKHLSALNRNRTLYLQLSNIAQKTIKQISKLSVFPDRQNEFAYLSERNSRDLLLGVVNDYDLFIRRMNEIIDQLLQITEQRSKDLNQAILAEAKASLASGVLHDLKHILTGAATESCLDTALREIEIWEQDRSGTGLGPVKELIQMVNQNLKEKIFPRIAEATRVPNDFQCVIAVADVFAEVSQLDLEDNQILPSPERRLPIVEIDCTKDISLCYNREIFFTLIKEMFRNALDYQKETGAQVRKYIMSAQDLDGEVEIRLLTDFVREEDAAMAQKRIAEQLSEDSKVESGFGIRALRSFVQHKTGGACRADMVRLGNQTGIGFSVPRK